MALRTLYPVYFDAALTRKEGRRVSKEMAVEHPTAESLTRAVTALGLTPTVESKVYSGRWYGEKGCVTVEYAGSKEALMKAVAEKL